MASFDPEEQRALRSSTSAQASEYAVTITKYPIKRLDLSIKKFIKVLEIDLNRLYKHSVNLTRYTNVEDWAGLHKEQVNASRTVQQIKANIREIEKARDMVNQDDLDEFDRRVYAVKMKAVSSLQEFLPYVGIENKSPGERIKDVPGAIGKTGHGDLDSQDKVVSQHEISSSINFRKVTVISTDASSLHYNPSIDATLESPLLTPYGSLPASAISIPSTPAPLELHVAPHNSDASQSWEQLQENIVELSELVNHFASEVDHQGEHVDAIEENIETAHEHVKEATISLAKAARYKSALLPVMGMVVGGVFGGPVGLVCGAKLGGLAVVTGGIGGFAGGRYVKKRQASINEMEMSNMSDKRSISLTDLPSDTPDKQQTNINSNASQNSRLLDVDDKHNMQEEERSWTNSATSNISGAFSSVTTSVKSYFSYSRDNAKT